MSQQPAVDPYAASRDGIADPFGGNDRPSISRQVRKISCYPTISPENTLRPGGNTDTKRLLHIRLDELQSGNYPQRALIGDGSYTAPSLTEQIALLKQSLAALDCPNKMDIDPWELIWQLDYPGNQLTDVQYNQVASTPSTSDAVSTSSSSSAATNTNTPAVHDPRSTDDDIRLLSDIRVGFGHTPLDPVTEAPMPPQNK